MKNERKAKIELGLRVKSERERLGWTQSRLAYEVARAGFDVAQSTIGNIEAGMVINPRCLVQIAMALGVDAVWLRTGIGQKKPLDSAGNAVQGARPFGAVTVTERVDLPLYRTTSNGTNHGVFRLYRVVKAFLSRPQFLVGAMNAFSVEVHDDINAPAYRVGDVVTVDPDQPGRQLDDCVFTSTQGMSGKDGTETTIGRFVDERADFWIVLHYARNETVQLQKAQYTHALKILERRLR